jgi:hypothetical protein
VELLKESGTWAADAAKEVGAKIAAQILGEAVKVS